MINPSSNSHLYGPSKSFFKSLNFPTQFFFKISNGGIISHKAFQHFLIPQFSSLTQEGYKSLSKCSPPPCLPVNGDINNPLKSFSCVNTPPPLWFFSQGEIFSPPTLERVNTPCVSQTGFWATSPFLQTPIWGLTYNFS